MAEEHISYCKKWVILTVGLGMNTVIGANDYFLGPFLPNYHEERGVSVTVNGIIFGASPVGEASSAFFTFQFLLSSRNKKLLALSGMLMAGFSQILFGLLKILVPTNNYVYTTLAIALRFAVGFGIGANFSTGTPIFLKLFPEMRGRVCSYFVAAVAVGGVVGPTLGSVLYSWGGFPIPFWVVGFYSVILAVIGVFIIPKQKFPKPSKIETASFISKPGVCVVIISSILPIAAMGFFILTLSPFLLENYGIAVSGAGLFMVPLPLARAIISPLYGYFVDKGFGTLIYLFVGFLMTSLGYLGLYLFQFLDNSVFSLTLLEILLFITSCSCCAVFSTLIPTLIEVYQASVQNDDEDVASEASAIFLVCTNSGLFWGSAVCGGFLKDAVGFYNSILVMCCMTLAGGAVSGTYFWKMKSFCRKRKSRRNEENEKTASLKPLLGK